MASLKLSAAAKAFSKKKKEAEAKKKELEQEAVMQAMIDKLSQPTPTPTIDINGLAEALSNVIPQQPQKVVVEQKEQLSAEAIEEIVSRQTQEVLQGYKVPELPPEPQSPHIQVIREELDTEGLVTNEELDKVLKRIDQAIMSASGGGSAKEIPYEGYEFIASVNDFPVADSSGIITLKRNKVYFLVGDIDLKGRRLVLEEDVCLLGGSSENASLTSTGLDSNEYLITTDWTFPCRHITFKNVDKAIGVNLNNTSTDTNLALDWTGVNFTGCTINVRCGDADNFIYDKGAVLGSGSFEFFGQIGTIGIANSLFVGSGSSYPIFDIESTANITRRFRIIYSSLVAFGSTNAINVDASASVLNQAYILDTCNFSGGGTYLTGVTASDNKALFVNNIGITNSADISQYYMNNNATATVISNVGVEVKVAGTTTSSDVTSKFTNITNRATYVGALDRYFKVTATMSLSSGNNNQIGAYVAKNGTILSDSGMFATTNSGGRVESVFIQTLVELTENDYIEIFVENNSSTSNITVTDLNVIVD